MKRLLPHPIFSIFIVILWLFLTKLTFGQLLLGFAIGIFTGHVKALLQSESIHIHRLSKVFVLVYHMFVDMISSNIALIQFILTGGRGKQSGFVIIQLDLTDRRALALLSCVLTVSPNTAWVAYNSKKSELLLHILDLSDADNIREKLKNRYEKPLLEIFK